MNWLRSLIRQHPMPALVLGKTLLVIGAIMVLSAVFGRTALVAFNTTQAQANLPAAKTLAEAFAQYPTDLVPEGPLGFTIAAVLVLVGMGLTVLAGDAGKKGRGRRVR
ncbi:MAG: hypothetical protein V4609_16865 [Pseudomonadota bacterium]